MWAKKPLEASIKLQALLGTVAGSDHHVFAIHISSRGLLSEVCEEVQIDLKKQIPR